VFPYLGNQHTVHRLEDTPPTTFPSPFLPGYKVEQNGPLCNNFSLWFSLRVLFFPFLPIRFYFRIQGKVGSEENKKALTKKGFPFLF
jgi:hypothetical protein